MDMLTHKVNHTAIKLGAIFDLLFSQCDRHQQNIFIRDDGNLQFIDNDQVGVDAVFLFVVREGSRIRYFWTQFRVFPRGFRGSPQNGVVPLFPACLRPISTNFGQHSWLWEAFHRQRPGQWGLRAPGFPGFRVNKGSVVCRLMTSR